MDQLAALIKKIEAQGDVTDATTPAPVVSLENFFEGNEDLGSIGCNLLEHPGIDHFYEVLRAARDRPEVQDVVVEISEVMEGQGEWPFSECIYLLTSASAAEVESWLATLEPDEIIEGWFRSQPPAGPVPASGMRVLSAWWD